MKESMADNQRFMKETQRLTMERQMVMQNAMRERAMAVQLARARDLFYWFGAFYATSALAIGRGISVTKNPRLAAPLLPLTFILGYQYDLAYGGKVERIQRMAEAMLEEESQLFLLPKGMPDFDEIEARRVGKSN